MSNSWIQGVASEHVLLTVGTSEDVVAQRLDTDHHSHHERAQILGVVDKESGDGGESKGHPG